jgi:CP family cyanate transporter-like MFS transporter
MALVVLRAPDPPHAAALSGMVQSAGYAMAATGPFAVGLIHDLSGSWDASIVFLIVVTAGLLAAGLAAARPGTIGGAQDLP